jgi:hypothetical protein
VPIKLVSKSNGNSQNHLMPSRLHGPEYEVVRPVQLVEYPYSPDFQIETAFSLERFAHVFER